MTTQTTRWSQFGVLITVFFFWGFVAASNDILIPVFKKAFNLTQAQSQYVAVAFYVAYTVGSLIYVAVSKIIGLDLLNKIGYKNGICLGLVISALGTLLFYPAANTGSFNLMLSGLFIVGLGFSLQQIAANPLAIVIGDPKTGAQRLTLAGGINNFGTTIGPLLVSVAIFGSVLSGGTEASIESVKTPYLVLGVAFILVAIFLKFSSVPNHIDLEKLSENEAQDSSKLIHKKSALGYPQLVLGMIAIFVYVGVEVSTISNLPAYLEKFQGVALHEIAPYVSLYWASLMIGRWTAASGACAAKPCVSTKGARRLDSIARSQLLRVADRIVSYSKIEALLTSTVNGPPSPCTAIGISFSTCDSISRSARSAQARRPMAVISFTTSSASLREAA